jgi:hypothetical protein
VIPTTFLSTRFMLPSREVAFLQHRPLLQYAAPLALVLASAAPAAARPTLPPPNMEQLGRYEVLTFHDPAGGGMMMGKAIGVFDATPDEVFRTVTAYEHYPEFAPRVVQAKVVDRQGDARASVLLTTNLPWPLSDAWVLAQFEHERLPNDTYRIRFWQLRGSMKRYHGSILIEPWSKWKTTVTYELLAEPDVTAPRGLINSKVEASTGKYVHALRQRINDLHKLGLLHPRSPPNPNLTSPLTGPRQPLHAQDIAQQNLLPPPAAKK